MASKPAPVRPCRACNEPLGSVKGSVCPECRPAWICCPDCGAFGRRATPTAKICLDCHRRPYESPECAIPPPEMDPTRDARIDRMAERAAAGASLFEEVER